MSLTASFHIYGEPAVVADFRDRDRPFVELSIRDPKGSRVEVYFLGADGRQQLVDWLSAALEQAVALPAVEVVHAELAVQS